MSEIKPRIVAIVQARMGSTRLPGKVLMPISEKPMVWHVLNRLSFAKKIDVVILAIPDTKENDVLEKFAKENDIIYVRGSEEDVLDRYYKAAERFKVDVIVRITADCPLIDPQIVDAVIKKHLSSDADYTSNVVERTFPRGLDVEVFNFTALDEAHSKAKEEHQREHVSVYFLENPKIFRLQNIEAEAVLKRPDLRLTVDTKEDLTLVREIYKHFKGAEFLTKEVIGFLDKNTDLIKINSQVKQKEFVSLRIAKPSDIKFLFNLRNEKYVYENSRAARPVEWNEHINWSGIVIAGKTNKELFIIEYADKKVGQLRLDHNGSEVEVSISLVKDFHSMGIATKAVFIAIEKLKSKGIIKTILAEVNENNLASKKLFEKLGFKLQNKKPGWLKYYFEL